MTTTWESLLTTALLGTERRATQIPPDAPAPLTDLPTDDSERLLLSAAGVMAVYRRAGYVPADDSRALGEAAPDETLPRCSMRATGRLLELLTHPAINRLLIGEWLVIMAGKRKRLPHVFLPDVMQGIRRDSALIPLALPVLGERGRWLAAQNPDWEAIFKPSKTESWVQTFLAEAPRAEASDAEKLMIDSLRDKHLRDSSEQHILGKHRLRWSEPLVEAFTRRLTIDYDKKKPASFDNEIAGLFAASVARSSLGSLSYRLKSAAGQDKRPFFLPFVEMLDLRRDMLQELSHE